ncbi:hypothetical protein GCM10023085_42200 [Actinomadura viridis]|uniref:Probable endolytic peptidoglycan transglycosylase RlpA n=1 Tax=Actinomadura viridis TaxID=58110 RepID=A0A931DS95_9ACTN|nr:septal ring lytic transglycosylase RlpA family protein [Actinomadura viridis]MBG6092505.1 rare lipoprotein A [Actinomadura viridis]
MGSAAKHRSKTRIRTILIASGVAVAVLAAGAWTLAAAKTGGSAKAAGATGTAPDANVPPADPPRAVPSRASRDDVRAAPPDRPPLRAGALPEKRAKAAEKKSRPEKAPEKKPAYRVTRTGSCEASFYWEGQMTASGERFDPGELTAAHKTLPMGSKVRVTNKHNGRKVTVRINDRGPYAGGRCLDLSKAAMAEVRGTGAGVIPVRYEVLRRS